MAANGVEGIASLAEACVAHGIAFVVAPRTMPCGTEFYVRDPGGHVLAFIESA